MKGIGKEKKGKQFSDNEKGKKMVCVHEFFEKGSCQFNRTSRGCNFSHEITDDMRKDIKLSDRAKKIRQNMKIKPARDVRNGKGAITANKICETSFKNGPNTCDDNCTLRHDLDFERIKRGICHYYVLGICQRNEKCIFSHEVPETIMNDKRTQEAAERFAARKSQAEKGSADSSARSTNVTHNQQATDDSNPAKSSDNREQGHEQAEKNNITVPTSVQNMPFPTYHFNHQQPQGNLNSHFLWDMRRMIQGQPLIHPYPQSAFPPQFVPHPQFMAAQ